MRGLEHQSVYQVDHVSLVQDTLRAPDDRKQVVVSVVNERSHRFQNFLIFAENKFLLEMKPTSRSAANSEAIWRFLSPASLNIFSKIFQSRSTQKVSGFCANNLSTLAAHP